MNKSKIENSQSTLQQDNFSHNALRVLNYVKKHNSRIRARWYCGISIYRVWKDEKELSYPTINEETWCEISHLFKQYGDYQQTHFYNLHFKESRLC